jgi:hypothetical protein
LQAALIIKGMGKYRERSNEEKGLEKLSRWGRNINILGALAIGGVALAIPGPNVVLGSWAGLNAVQAAGFEWARKHSKKRNKKDATQNKTDRRHG